MHIMVIEDNPGDFLLLEQYVKLAGTPCIGMSNCMTLMDSIETLSNETPDLIFLDLFLPDSKGLLTFDAINRVASNVPIIILSGITDSSIAIKAIQSGAQDYLIKGDFDEKVLEKAINYSIERKKIQQILNKSLERHKLVAEATNDVIWDWDITTQKVTHLSHAIEHSFGYDESELDETLMWWYHRVHPEDIKGLVDRIVGFMKAGQANAHHTFRFRDRQGEYRLVHARALIIYERYAPRPFAVRMVGVLQDITAFKKVEAKLSWSMQRYETIAKATSDVVLDWDISTDVVYVWKEDIAKLFGYLESDGLSSKWWLNKVHADDWKRNEKLLSRCLEEESTNFGVEFRFLCANGTYKHIYSRCFFFYDKEKRPYRMIGSLQDVTELKDLQEKVIQERIVTQQKITEATIQSQEQEREELGRELHDNINQILATSKMFVDISIKNPFMREELLPKSFDYLATAIEELRKLSKSLVPPSLGDIGLEEAVKELLSTAFTSNGTVKYNFECKTMKGQYLPNDVQLMLYRIIQEQLNNITKYAKPSEVNILLTQQKDSLRVCISDNGKGFDPSHKAKGIGLRNIRSRAEMFGGKMKIVSSPGHGCTLNVVIPTLNKQNKKPVS